MNLSALIPCFDHLFVSDCRQLPCGYFPCFSLFHCCFALVFLVAWGIGKTCVPNCNGPCEIIPFAAMWSSWYLCGTPSNRSLIHSSASTIQAYLAMCFQILVQVFSAAIYWCFTRHSCWHRNFQLSTNFFHGMFKLFITWFKKKIPRNCLAFSSIGFWIAHFSFALYFAASDICFHISDHNIVGSRSCLFPLLNLLWTMFIRQVAFHSTK